jgi:hypothetical protein
MELPSQQPLPSYNLSSFTPTPLNSSGTNNINPAYECESTYDLTFFLSQYDPFVGSSVDSEAAQVEHTEDLGTSSTGINCDGGTAQNPKNPLEPLGLQAFETY